MTSSAVRHHRDAARGGSAGPQDSSGPVRGHRREAEHHHEDVEKRGEESGPNGASRSQQNQQKHHGEIHRLIPDLQHGERTEDGMFALGVREGRCSHGRHGRSSAVGTRVATCWRMRGSSHIDVRECAASHRDRAKDGERGGVGRRSVALASVVLQKYVMAHLKNPDLFQCNLDLNISSNRLTNN